MAANISSPSTGKAEAERHDEFEASLGNVARYCLKTRQTLVREQGH